MAENSEILEGLKTAFIDRKYNSNLAYKPQFISNNYKIGKKVSATLEDELAKCNEFIFSVAFITEGGIALLLQSLKELEKRGVKGRILILSSFSRFLSVIYIQIFSGSIAPFIWFNLKFGKRIVVCSVAQIQAAPISLSEAGLL